jgi:hypothetical protein
MAKVTNPNEIEGQPAHRGDILLNAAGNSGSSVGMEIEVMTHKGVLS